MKKSRKKQLIAEYLFRTANLLQKQSVRDGLTLRQAMLLGTLEEAEGSANLSDLSERFGCTRQNIRQLVDALASKGFVRTEKRQTTSAKRSSSSRKAPRRKIPPKLYPPYLRASAKNSSTALSNVWKR